MTFLWNEKYRPTKLSDFLCNEDIRGTFEKWIENNQIPHLLLSGPPGGGKTSLAKILINEMDCDSLFINASDNNSIDTVRTQITDFAMSAGFHPLKLIVLDEFDGFSAEGQKALRNLMEEYADSTRFVLTCNFPEKIIAAIHSRVTTIDMQPVPPTTMAKSVIHILLTENVTFDPQDVKKVFAQYYPDYRKLLNELQRYSVGGTLTLPKQFDARNVYEEVVQEIQNSTDQDKTVMAIRILLSEANIKTYIGLYNTLYERVHEFSRPGKMAGNITAISKGIFQDTTVPDKEINAMSTICDILQNNY